MESRTSCEVTPDRGRAITPINTPWGPLVAGALVPQPPGADWLAAVAEGDEGVAAQLVRNSPTSRPPVNLPILGTRALIDIACHACANVNRRFCCGPVDDLSPASAWGSATEPLVRLRWGSVASTWIVSKGKAFAAVSSSDDVELRFDPRWRNGPLIPPGKSPRARRRSIPVAVAGPAPPSLDVHKLAGCPRP
jgi:hypothetical protein